MNEYSSDPDCNAALAPYLAALRAEGRDHAELDAYATSFAAAFAQGRAEGAAEERARCKAIFESPEAAGRKEVATHFAFATNMNAQDAISTLRTMPRRH